MLSKDVILQQWKKDLLVDLKKSIALKSIDRDYVFFRERHKKKSNINNFLKVYPNVLLLRH